jgi:hypothetical protein
MKPYRTSLLGIAALIMLLCSNFLISSTANASCTSISLITKDTAWTFSAAAGSSQARSLIIENVTDSDMVVTLGVTGTSQFGLSHGDFTIPAHDTVSVIITFQPPSTAAVGSVTGLLKVTKHGTDCSSTLGLIGTVTSSNGGGHDLVVTMSPTSYNFGPIVSGADTCHAFYLTNYTGTKVTITSLGFKNGKDFTITPAFNGATIDSGGYYRFQVCYSGDATTTKVEDSVIAWCTYGGTAHMFAAVITGTTSVPPPQVLLIADPHTYNFGTVLYGSSACKDIVVTNKSNSYTVLRGWSSCDSNNANFTVSPGFTGNDTLSPGSSMTFTVCFKPQAANHPGYYCGLYINYFQNDPRTDGQLSVSLYGSSLDSGNTSHPTCLRTEQGAGNSDAIIAGTTADHTLELINNSNHAITIDSIFIDGDPHHVFTITSQLPIKVPANSTTTLLGYTFAPPSGTTAKSFTATGVMILSGDSLGCTEIKSVLEGFVTQSGNTSDTVVRGIFGGDRILGIEGSNNRPATDTFYFTNDVKVDATVTDISVDSTQYFSITFNPSPTPFVLHPGQNVTIIVTFIATDHHVHHAHLTITANHNLKDPTFELEGLTLASAGVAQTLPADVAVSLSPNPASNYVTVDMDGVRSADIQVYDLLGQSVTSAKATGEWKWNAANVADGTYIVRIAGMSTSGEQFVTSKRVIIAR